MNKFTAPIPGMSLTREPGNAPWEQPPLYAKPEEALAFYLQKLSDEEMMDDILFSLESGMPLSILIDSMTSYGVMEGYHSIDVKMILSPVLHEHILTLAQSVGIDVIEDTGPTKDERMEARDKQRMLILLEKALDEAPAPEELNEETLDDAEDLLEGETPDNEEASSIIPRRSQ